MKPITIKQLKHFCNIEINAGNGDKVIMISNDDEGNGYHYLYLDFITPLELIENGYEEIADYIDKKIASIKNTIILG